VVRPPGKPGGGEGSAAQQLDKKLKYYYLLTNNDIYISHPKGERGLLLSRTNKFPFFDHQFLSSLSTTILH